MKTLPQNVTAYKKTPEFTEQSVPAGLLKNHQTKKGVWGKIVVLDGILEYTMIEPEVETVQLHNLCFGVVEPDVLHHIKPLGRVTFYVEFYR